MRTLAASCGLAALLASTSWWVAGCGQEETSASRPGSPEAWKRQRARLDETLWADERLAGEHEKSLVHVWDGLLRAQRAGDPVAAVEVLASFPFEELRLGRPGPREALEHGIERVWSAKVEQVLGPAEWRAWLEERVAGGYRLLHSEFHHARFEPPRDGEPARSRVAVAFHLVDPAGARRLVVEGELGVEWSGQRDARGNPLARLVDASELTLWTRPGEAAFERILAYEWREGRRRSRLHPVLLYDLDGDGLSEIVLAGAGRVLWNEGGGRFRDAPLLAHPYRLAEAGVIADLDGDARPDLLSARVRGDLVLYRGGDGGSFPDPPEATVFDYPLGGPSALSVGDVDADGDLDVWLAQYKPAYLAGQMPTPFYDANDGYPSYLLRNDGRGHLEPATEAAGLAAKRHRRTYASSFVDLDGDADLDLLVVSDYSGIDLHENDGRGHFSDATHTIRGDRHLFGMSVSFGDFDADGRLDFWAAGMASTTARRLESLGLARRDHPDIAAMRMRMAFGNRMYLARDDGWHEPDFADQVARTGWTWGTSAFDLDNDGDRDLFAANGHVSGESSEDYCSTFWTHDIYDGRSQGDPSLERLFDETGLALREGRQSWDGHQTNRLLMNRDGRGFVDVAFLLGVGDDFDSRSALADDLDGDGRVDLLVTEDHGLEGERLHVYRNRLETRNGWIGVRLREQGGGISPVGAIVRVRTPERTHVGSVVTGDSLMGQHPAALHFGLGDETRVEWIEVRWVGGRSLRIADPEPGRHHTVEMPINTDTRTASRRR